MSAALVIVEKTYQGQTWENTHCVGLGTDYTSRPSDADLTTLGCGTALTTTTTASGGGTNFLQRLVSWERQMSYAATLITRVYVTDGKRNRLGNTEYFVASPNLVGLSANPADMTTILPGNIALVINRNPVGFGQRPGRIFWRGLLIDADVILGGPRLVTWTAAGAQTAYSTSIGNVTIGSGLNTHLFGGTNAANGVYCIPKYRRTKPVPPPPNQEGELINAVPVSSITVGYPTGRQATRGRRRSR